MPTPAPYIPSMPTTMVPDGPLAFLWQPVYYHALMVRLLWLQVLDSDLFYHADAQAIFDREHERVDRALAELGDEDD